ncbi:MAG: hypothetical protein ACI89D_001330, partial [Bermanella sp.]
MMAIDLPPVMPPALTAVQQLAPYAAATLSFVRKLGDYQIKLTGDHRLDMTELDTLFAKAKTPSQLILLINAATYDKGHLLVRVLYSAPVGDVVHVHAIQTTEAQVKSNAFISDHFSDLADDVNLTREEFKIRDVLATIHSERIGVDYSISYQTSAANPNTLDLIFSATDDSEHDATDFIVQLGNQGNRFGGRYFIDLGFKHDFGNGIQFSAGYETAITEWGESREGEDYHQIQLKLDKAYIFSLYGVEARHTQHTGDFCVLSVATTACILPTTIGLPLPCAPTASSANLDVELDAEIDQLAVTGNQVVSSDIDHRFTLSQRLDWTDSLIDSNVGSTVQHERYAT